MIKNKPNRTILITGANRGIGLGLAKHYISNGAQVFATYRNPNQTTELNELSNQGSLSTFQLDVTDHESLTKLKKELSGQCIDILINNAGTFGGEKQELDSMDYAEWVNTFKINTIAPFAVTTALIENLKLADKPRVITLSSQMGSLGRETTGYYSYRSSKAAVNKVMQGLALDLRNEGIIVCPIHPGWVKTDMGGPNAEISIQESVNGISSLIESLTMEESGRFWTWDNVEHPW